MGEHAINLTLRYFGQLAEIAKVTEDTLPFKETETTAELIERVKELHPGFHGLPISIAKNGHMAQPDDLVQLNDHLDLFPPFSGG